MPPLNLVGDFGGGGMLLAFGVVCALLEAQRSGRGPGGRRGDGRRRGGAHDDDPRVPRHGHLGGRARHQPARHRRALLRGRTRPRTASSCRSGRSSAQFYAELLEKLGLTDDDSMPHPQDKAQWPRDEGALRRDLPAPRPATSGASSSRGPTPASRRCCRWARRRSTRTTSHRGTFVERNGVVQPAPAPRFSRTAGRDPAAAGVPGPAHRRGARRLGLRRRRHRQAAGVRRHRLIDPAAVGWPAWPRSSASTPTPTTSPSPPAAPWRRPPTPGHRVVLVVATRGEHGEPQTGVLATASSSGSVVWRRRTGRPRSSGAERVEFLGYEDSGMMGEPTNDNPELLLAGRHRGSRREAGHDPARGGRRRPHDLRRPRRLRPPGSHPGAPRRSSGRRAGGRRPRLPVDDES